MKVRQDRGFKKLVVARAPGRVSKATVGGTGISSAMVKLKAAV